MTIREKVDGWTLIELSLPQNSVILGLLCCISICWKEVYVVKKTEKTVSMCMLVTLMILLMTACSFGGGGGSPGGNTPTTGITPTSGTTPTTSVTPTSGATVTVTSTSNTGGSNTVDLAAMSFTPSSITIPRGTSVTLRNQTATVHIISNGTWNGNVPAPKTEAGAPVVNGMTFNTSGETKTIGPFTTPGTFHYYCSVHPGMNLVVTVQ